MTPDQIPTSITELVDGEQADNLYAQGFPVLSQNDAAKLIAHFWPAIEAHIRKQIARDILNDQTDVPWRYTTGAPGGWIDRRDRTKAVAIILNGPIPEAP